MSISTPTPPPAYVPPFLETDVTVRSRLQAALPDGLSYEPGTFTSDWLEINVAEFVRMWAMLNQLLAQCFSSWATGQQLDAVAASYGLLRSQGANATGVERFYAPAGTPVPPNTICEAPQTDPNADRLQYATANVATVYATTAGYVDVPLVALNIGSEYNQAAGAVTLLDSSVNAITAITNPNPITGGTDIATDAQLRPLVQGEAQFPVGSGTIADYQGWGLEVPGVGSVAVYPLWDTAGVNPGIYDGRQNGSVMLSLRDPNNAPVAPLILQATQQHIAPSRQIVAMIEDLEGWYAYTPTDTSTTTAGLQTLPASTITVEDTTDFTSSGTVDIEGIGEVTYTGTTSTTLTGCEGGAGPVPSGSTVTLVNPVDITWDTDNVQAGGSSLQVAVTADDATYVELPVQLDLSRFNGQWASTVFLWLKAGEWADIADTTTLVFMTDEDDYFSAELSVYSSEDGSAAPDSGSAWWLWAIDLDQFTATGTPDWATIETIQLQVAATDDTTMNADYEYVAFRQGSIGLGGRAPLGADVTCISPVLFPIDIAITNTLLDTGYALVDAPGETNAAVLLQTALTTFFQQLPPGATVRTVDLIRVIHNSAGILDFTLETPSENIETTGMQYAQLGDFAIS